MYASGFPSTKFNRIWKDVYYNYCRIKPDRLESVEIPVDRSVRRIRDFRGSSCSAVLGSKNWTRSISYRADLHLLKHRENVSTAISVFSVGTWWIFGFLSSDTCEYGGYIARCWRRQRINQMRAVPCLSNTNKSCMPVDRNMSVKKWNKLIATLVNSFFHWFVFYKRKESIRELQWRVKLDSI